MIHLKLHKGSGFSAQLGREFGSSGILEMTFTDYRPSQLLWSALRLKGHRYSESRVGADVLIQVQCSTADALGLQAVNIGSRRQEIY